MGRTQTPPRQGRGQAGGRVERSGALPWALGKRTIGAVQKVSVERQKSCTISRETETAHPAAAFYTLSAAL